MRSTRLGWAWPALLLLGACFGAIDLSDRSCPCVAGWVCEASSQRCVVETVNDASVSGDSLDFAPSGPQLVVLAGLPGGYGNLDGEGIGAVAARFRGTDGLAFDGSNLYVSDRDNHLLRKMVVASGAVSTIAGRRNQSGNIAGSDSTLDTPRGLWLDQSANILYFVQDHALRRTELDTGFTSLVAGSSSSGTTDGPGVGARFSSPSDLISAGVGSFYVADRGNHRIRKVAADGSVSTVVGGLSGSTDAPPLFNSPEGLALVGTDLYVADSGNATIRKISTVNGTATTVAGTAGVSGWRDEFGALARLDRPVGLAYDGSGRIYFADHDNRRVRVLDLLDARVSTIAGSGLEGGADGIGTAATFSTPMRLLFVAPGTLYVSDGDLVRRIDLQTKAVTTVAGMPRHPGKVDGPVVTATLTSPVNLAHDPEGNVYIAEGSDSTNRGVRKLVAAGTPTAQLSTLAVTGGASGLYALAIDPTTRDLYMVDAHAIRRRAASDGTVTALAGARDMCAFADGIGAAARFCRPEALAADGQGHLFVADSGTGRIRQIDVASGAVTTIAGGGPSSGADGVGALANIIDPVGIVWAGGGVLYVSDGDGDNIRKVVVNSGNLDGVVTTIAGGRGTPGSIDGLGTAARFAYPRQLAFDPADDVLYVADSLNALLRKVDLASGAVTTLAGVANQWGVRPGPLPAFLNSVTGVDFVPGLGLVIACPADNVLLTIR